LKEGLKEMAEEAERHGTFIGIEPANGHLIDTPEALLECCEAVTSSSIGAVIDPCNMITPENYELRDDVLRNAFKLLAERIVSIHVKDIIRTGDGEITTAAPGEGVLNYPLFLQLADKYKPKIHMTMEGLEEKQMAHSIQFVENIRLGNEEKRQLTCKLKHVN
jgi:L-ribulose-5-phosphate 3-epimerase